MPLGTEVGLGPCGVVLDGDPAPTERGTTAPHFSAHFALARSPILATVKLDHRTHFRAILTPNGSNEVFMQPLMPFGVSVISFYVYGLWGL